MRQVANASRFWVTPDGLVYSDCQKRRRLLKQMEDEDGYLRVAITDDAGHLKRRGVHQLVIETFGPPRPAGHLVRHLDADRKNNSLANLVWGTPLDNSNDRTSHGNTLKGARHGNAKLAEEQAAAILCAVARREFHADIAVRFGVSVHLVRAIAQRRLWSHLSTPPGFDQRRRRNNDVNASR